MRQSPDTRPSLLVRLGDPGDGAAWEEFVEIYAPLIRRLAAQKGLQDADAEDLIQETFQAVARAIAR
jgi:RNA polymerase sigma-70 factor (ECF subfamily)